jgi:signal transduction histidine kinase
MSAAQWARATLLATVAVTAAALALFIAAGSEAGSGPFALVGVGLGLLGLLIVSRAGNVVGWVFLVAGMSVSLASFADGYVHYSLLARPEPLPGTSLAGWLNNMAFTTLAAPLPLIFLLFPTGQIPSPRWRPVVWVWAAGLALLMLALAVRPGTVYATTHEQGGIEVVNPIGIPALESVLGPLIQVAVVALVMVAGISVVSLIVRFRRARGEERQQMKWLVYVAALIAILFLVLFATDAVTGDEPTGMLHTVSSFVWGTFAFLFAIGIPGAVAIAVLRYRLYDIDLVINKTLVYGSLAMFITAVYVGVVVGIGSAFGRGDEPNLGLSILATAVVAVAFQPVRERVQRLANRLVYGKRATPYEVLSDLSEQLSGTYASEDVLPRMARILAEGTGAREARVWLRIGGELTPAASWAAGDRKSPNVEPDVVEMTTPGSKNADFLVPVIHQGEDLGALSIAKALGDRLTPAEEGLVRDLASQAGLVLRNVRLIEDLKASRVRLVQAQDAERRRIERNIHDGAQQQLVALQVKLGLAKRLADDPERVDRLLAELQDETNQALNDLRDLARGIYPPLLADQGLGAALEAQARKGPVPIAVDADGLGRYPPEAEAAVYFCVLEALQNMAKYAEATRADVRLAAPEGWLTFEVTDDGAGFDPDTTPRGSGLTNMADRLAALGGAFEIRSNPGEGTTVTGRVPAWTVEPVA